MTSRFDIASFSDFDAEEDEVGFAQSAKSIEELILKEIEGGILANRIVLGGFSQGGAMSLLTGLTGSHQLAGLSVLSGWLPLRNRVRTASTLIATRCAIAMLMRAREHVRWFLRMLDHFQFSWGTAPWTRSYGLNKPKQALGI